MPSKKSKKSTEKFIWRVGDLDIELPWAVHRFTDEELIRSKALTPSQRVESVLVLQEILAAQFKLIERWKKREF